MTNVGIDGGGHHNYLMKERRCVILHCHLSKNAGTTFDWVLKRNFPDGFFEKKNTGGMRILLGSNIEAILRQDVNIKAFSTEQKSLPALIDHDYNDIQILPVAFLRNPIDRIVSQYHQLRKPNMTGRLALQAKCFSLREFVEYALSEKPLTQPIINGQTWIFSGLAKDINIARANLDRCFFVGIIERPIESYVVLESKLKRYFPLIDLSFIRRNVNVLHKEQTLAQRLNEIKQQLGDTLYDELRERNRIDFELRRYAVEKLENELANVADLEAKIQDFKRRNRITQRKLERKLP